jgi:hypothetical protein
VGLNLRGAQEEARVGLGVTLEPIPRAPLQYLGDSLSGWLLGGLNALRAPDLPKPDVGPR